MLTVAVVFLVISAVFICILLWLCKTAPVIEGVDDD